MSLQLLDEKSSSTPTTHKKQVIVAILTFISLAIFFSSNSYIAPLFTPSSPVESTERLCPSGKTLRPSSFYKDNSSVEYIIHDPEFRKESIKKLSGAVKIPTITFDYYQDPFVNPEQWNNFKHFLGF